MNIKTFEVDHKILDPIYCDLVGLLRKFLETNSEGKGDLSFNRFRSIWQSSRFSFIHLSHPKLMGAIMYFQIVGHCMLTLLNICFNDEGLLSGLVGTEVLPRSAEMTRYTSVLLSSDIICNDGNSSNNSNSSSNDDDHNSNNNDDVVRLYNQAVWNIGLIYSLYCLYETQIIVSSDRRKQPIRISVDEFSELYLSVKRIQSLPSVIYNDATDIYAKLLSYFLPCSYSGPIGILGMSTFQRLKKYQFQPNHSNSTTNKSLIEYKYLLAVLNNACNHNLSSISQNNSLFSLNLASLTEKLSAIEFVGEEEVYGTITSDINERSSNGINNNSQSSSSSSSSDTLSGHDIISKHNSILYEQMAERRSEYINSQYSKLNKKLEKAEKKQDARLIRIEVPSKVLLRSKEARYIATSESNLLIRDRVDQGLLVGNSGEWASGDKRVVVSSSNNSKSNNNNSSSSNNSNLFVGGEAARDMVGFDLECLNELESMTEQLTGELGLSVVDSEVVPSIEDKSIVEAKMAEKRKRLVEKHSSFLRATVKVQEKSDTVSNDATIILDSNVNSLVMLEDLVNEVESQAEKPKVESESRKKRKTTAVSRKSAAERKPSKKSNRNVNTTIITAPANTINIISNSSQSRHNTSISQVSLFNSDSDDDSDSDSGSGTTAGEILGTGSGQLSVLEGLEDMLKSFN